MKNLIFVGGTMGVGKTTVSRELQKLLPDCVFLDGDWCWDMKPFTVTEETKAMVNDNICHLLRNFLRCSLYQNIVFCWVMHDQSIPDGILSALQGENFRLWNFSLTCSEEALAAHLEQDIQTGVRQPDILVRSLPRLPLYQKVASRKLDVSNRSPAEAAALLARIITGQPMVEAAIFDMDGLMFDTERLYFQAWDYAGCKIGVGEVGELNWKCLGMNDEAAEKICKQAYGEDFDYPRFLSYVREFMADYLAENPLPVKSGLYELLEFLKSRHVPLAVASSSPEEIVLHHLERAGIQEYFTAVVCGNRVARSKPAPDIYLEACRQLGKDPAVCAALEDSRNGLWAAANAGCFPVMVPDLWQPDAQTLELLAVKENDLSDLIPWFSQNLAIKR